MANPTGAKRTRGVDARHDARRAEIVAALLRIISDRGLDGVSVRDIAAEAGVSVGRVQHYFPTKYQVLEAAFQQVNEWGGELVRRSIAEAGDPAPRAVLRAVAAALLPVDERNRQALQVGVAFLARALVDDQTAARLRTGYDELQGLFAVLLTRAREEGDAAPGLDPDREATLLLALLDGLGTLTLVGQRTVDEALSLVDAHLDRLLPGTT